MGLRRVRRTIPMLLAVAIIAIHAFIPFITNVYATSANTNIGIDSKDTSFWIGSLYFYDVNFHDYSKTSIQAFGIDGKVMNYNLDDTNYLSEVVFYDGQGEEIARSNASQTATSSKTAPFIQMSNLDLVKDGRDVAEIARYSVFIDTVEDVSDGSVLDTPSKNRERYNYDYVIDSYDIDIEVGVDNVYKVKEKIKAYFVDEYKHGIVRSLPQSALIERLDGTSSRIRTKVSDINVSEHYTTSRNDGNIDIKIGDADTYVHGSHEYEIDYTYNFGKDHNEEYDEFYFDLIGQEWDTIIGGISFTIHMPKDFDTSKVGFSSGRYGRTYNNYVSFGVVDNTISGEYDGILGSNEGLTVRITLDDGYFSESKSQIEPVEYVVFFVPIVCLAISAILWLIFGRDDRPVETIEFYPPEDLNSLEVALIAHGRINKKDVISLLFILANKGYISIKEIEKNKRKKITYRIYKLKPYDGDNEYEKLFYDGLFKYGSRKKDVALDDDKNDLREYVTLESLNNRFYRTINKIMESANTKSHRAKYFEHKTWARVLIAVMMAIGLFAPLVTIGYALLNEDFIGMLFMIAFYLPLSIIITVKVDNTLSRLIVLSFITIHFIVLACGFFFSSLFNVYYGAFYYIELAVVLVCVSGMAIFFKFMPRRTKRGNELYGKIKGLKTFMKTADGHRLEENVMNDKQYAYRLLPYAFVLGLSTKWMKRFESLGTEVEQPNWYNGDFTSYHDISRSLNSISRTATVTMSNSPSSSGGSSSGGFSSGGFSSSSSGGGFSGGGGGGGGGHSW